jgi:hypothetical protein
VAASDGTATVKDAGGKKKTVPLVTKASKTATVDTTKDAKTPASLPAGLCPVLVDWSSLVDCVDKHNLDWYPKAVNQRKGSTGFGWSDIKRWAKDTGVEVRAIEVYGKTISNSEARKRAAELVGKKVAKQLAIVRQPVCFDNTRGLEAGAMQDFVYCPPNSRDVRVSLLPAVMKDGQITGLLDTDSGVFIDCDNLWWIPELIKVPGTPPQVNKPPKTPPSSPPGEGGCVGKKCGGTPECTHDCTTLEAKDYKQGTQYQGNNKPGGGGKAPTQTDPVEPPKGGNPPPKYTPPPKPTPKPDPTQPPRPTPTQPPQGGDAGGNNDSPGDPGQP